MRSLNSGARKLETVESTSWQQATQLEKTARIRVLVFFFFHFPSVVVRSSKIEVFGMATVGRGYNEPERRRVFKPCLMLVLRVRES